MKLRYVLLLCLLTLLSACAVGPDYERPEAEIPDDWRFKYVDNSAVVNTLWWEQFNDEVLNELISVALENNRDVRIAAARVEEFAARVDIARSGFYPQIGYQADGSRNRISDNARDQLPPGTPSISNNFQATLNVGWELDVWGKIRRATESARANLLSAEETKRTVILTLVTSVATSYVQLRALDRRLEIAWETLKSRKETLELFELQFRGGVVSQLEVAQVRSEYELAAVSIPSLERQIALLENSLSVLLGKNPAPIPRGKTISELILPKIPEGIPSEVLERRPDIRGAEQDLVAANAQIGVAKAEYFPSISLTGLLGFASDELSNLASSASAIWGVGAGLTGPIFTAGQVSGQVRVSEAVQKQALNNYLKTIQTAFREVDDALVSNQKTREELKAQGRRVEALREYARFANLRYDEGQVSYIEVLDSERRLFEAELSYAQNQSDVYIALVNTYKAMGGGWIIEAEQQVSEAEQTRIAKEEAPLN